MPGFLNTLRGALDVSAHGRAAYTEGQRRGVQDLLGFEDRRRHADLDSLRLKMEQGQYETQERARYLAAHPKEDRAVQARRLLLKAKHPDLSDLDLDTIAADKDTTTEYLKPDPIAAFQARRDYIVAHPVPRAPAAPNPNAETPSHRNARQAVQADDRALSQTQRDISALERSRPTRVGGEYLTPADSTEDVGLLGRLRALTARRDSIQGARDRHASALSGTPVADDAAPDMAAYQRELDDADAMYQRIVKAPTATPNMKQRAAAALAQRKARISEKYGVRQ